MVLVFASYNGEHYNTIMDSIEDAVRLIGEYCRELETDIEQIEISIRQRLQSHDDAFVMLEDNTWFTVTKYNYPIYSILFSTQEPCSAEVVKSFVSLKNARKALERLKEEEIYDETEDYFVTNDAEACYQIQKQRVGE